MKALRLLATCAFATALGALSACTTTPELIRETSAGTTSTVRNEVLIVLSSKVFGATAFGSEGEAYMSGVGAGLQAALAGFPTKIIEVDGMTLGNPLGKAYRADRPSHAISVSTVSFAAHDGIPFSAVWQMDVASLTITDLPGVDGKPNGLRVATTPIYKLRAKGDTCFVTDHQAERCGETMGKMLGAHLLASHVITATGS